MCDQSEARPSVSLSDLASHSTDADRSAWTSAAEDGSDREGDARDGPDDDKADNGAGPSGSAACRGDGQGSSRDAAGHRSASGSVRAAHPRAQQQNQVARAVKRARELALLPYVAEGGNDQRERGGRGDRDRDR